MFNFFWEDYITFVWNNPIINIFTFCILTKEISKAYDVLLDGGVALRGSFLIDADGKTFGRILTEVATFLRGKHKPSFTPNVDCGDYVVIINAEKANSEINNPR